MHRSTVIGASVSLPNRAVPAALSVSSIRVRSSVRLRLGLGLLDQRGRGARVPSGWRRRAGDGLGAVGAAGLGLAGRRGADRHVVLEDLARLDERRLRPRDDQQRHQGERQRERRQLDGQPVEREPEPAAPSSSPAAAPGGHRCDSAGEGSSREERPALRLRFTSYMSWSAWPSRLSSRAPRRGVRGTDADPDPGHARLEQEGASQVDRCGGRGRPGRRPRPRGRRRRTRHRPCGPGRCPPHAALQPAGHLLQQLVARGVAECR